MAQYKHSRISSLKLSGSDAHGRTFGGTMLAFIFALLLMLVIAGIISIGITFSTDIIVGFPGETDEQFRKTLDLADYCKFDLAYTFVYSPRSGTPAAKMPDDTPAEEDDTSEKYSQFLNRLYNTEGLDADIALKNCASQELLFSTVKQYYESIDEKALELQQFYEAEDWENYEIKVHALKSTSRLIGALELSKMAEQLESFAAKKEISEIQNNHKNLLDLFLSFKKTLKSIVEEKSANSPKPEISKEELEEEIKKLISSADTFDIDGLDMIISHLSDYSLPLDFSQKFDKIQKSIEKVDFKELRVLLSQWSNKE